MSTILEKKVKFIATHGDSMPKETILSMLRSVVDTDFKPTKKWLKENTNKDIRKLLDAIKESYIALLAGSKEYDFDKRDALCNELFTVVDGHHIQQVPMADGYGIYYIHQSDDHSCILEWVPVFDSWDPLGVSAEPNWVRRDML